MAKFIEICGAPGVGKSTVFREISRRERKEHNWTAVSISNPYGKEGVEGFLRRITGAVLQREAGGFEGILNRLRRGVREFRKGKNHIDRAALKEAGDRFVKEYPEYVEACWKNIYLRQRRSSNGLDLRFEKAEFIYRVVKKIQVILEKEEDKIVLTDEGLINLIDRGLYKSEDGEEKEEIRGLLGTMPLPRALVYLDLEPEEHVRRLLTRTDVRDMHQGLDEYELAEFTRASKKKIETAIQLLEFQGIPVLFLDASEPVKESADRITAFAEGLYLEKASFSSPGAVAFQKL